MFTLFGRFLQYLHPSPTPYWWMWSPCFPSTMASDCRLILKLRLLIAEINILPEINYSRFSLLTGMNLLVMVLAGSVCLFALLDPVWTKQVISKDFFLKIIIRPEINFKVGSSQDLHPRYVYVCTRRRSFCMQTKTNKLQHAHEGTISDGCVSETSTYYFTILCGGGPRKFSGIAFCRTYHNDHTII